MTIFIKNKHTKKSLFDKKDTKLLTTHKKKKKRVIYEESNLNYIDLYKSSVCLF